MNELLARARALGRAAEPSTFHSRVLSDALGWSGNGLAATVFDPAFVRDAPSADVFLVPVDDGIGEVQATVEPLTTLDGEWGRVTLTSTPTRTLECDVERAVAVATIVLCADALGAAEAAMEAAVAHVQQRHQWGRPIAAFQVVQHRCADMLLDVTVAESTILAAAQADDIVLAASACKAAVIERCRRVTASAHQLAGGQGVLADAPFHRWYRRVKMAEPALGTTRQHRAAIADAEVRASARR